MKFNKRYISLFVMPTLFLACGKSGADQKMNMNTGPSGPTPVEGLVLESSNTTNRLILNGNIMAYEQVSLQPEISGRVTDIYFTEGQFVQEGKLLVKLNDADLRAQLKKAEVARDLAAQDESRKKQLLDIKAISSEEYEQAATMLKSAEADIELIKAQIEKTEIRAPFPGVIGLRMISTGTFVNAGQVIAELQQIQPMKLDFAVPEKYSGNISERSRVSFTVEGMRDTFSAKIYAVDPAVDLSSRTFRVRATTQNPGNRLKSGAFANVSIAIEELQNAIMIPASSVIPEIRGHKVLTIKNGKVTAQLVELGMRTDRQVHAIEGLSVGDTLITSGLIQLKEGQSVQLKSKS